MTWKRRVGLGLALMLGTSSAVQAQAPLPSGGMQNSRFAPAIISVVPSTGAPMAVGVPAASTTIMQKPEGSGTSAGAPAVNATEGTVINTMPSFEPAAAPPADDAPLGPTPLGKVGFLQGLIFGDNADKAKLKISGWADFDYTYRSTGSGRNNIAPVMNRFGNEFLARQIGLYISKPLDDKELSWGFNSIFIVGSDASFLGPTAGSWANTNPRFGAQFTDLNLTAHLPILTEGGVDVKAGRQTTVLGPMGALPWQRYFTSADYAWYNLEEGRYTGVSANWKISKQLSWYNGVEIGGWGVFFDNAAHGLDYITQINYWLDAEATKTKVWTTVLTGPTGFSANGNTTTVEIGIQRNWNKYFYSILDSQLCYSKAPIFFTPPKGYQERAYDVYTYNGVHLNSTVDVNTRLEWYKDTDGGGYPGGFGIPHTDFFATTLGVDYHPVKYLQVRPEIRYDYATHPAFGENNNLKNQLSLAAEMLFKF